MNLSDFVIGQDFYNAVGKWRCTDIGQRTITAIRWPDDEELPDMGDLEGWLLGPPYVLPEVVFDEKDMGLAYRSLAEAVGRSAQSAHPGFSQEDVTELFKGKRRRMDERAAGARLACAPLMDQLMRYERVIDGRVLHPHDWTKHGQVVCVFDVFARTWSDVPLRDFLRARVAQEEDYRRLAAERGPKDS